ncbi:P-loop containing nucleoside triphosphate hydrolase protein [Mycena vulgaris]|nr:P-loop containing nucleoside triphosphate hydrolase protein [Mycena vulgaris]
MSRLEKLVQYTTLAVTTAQEISDAAQIPFLAMASTMTLAILRSVDAVKTNKADCILMVEQIHDIMCTIISLCSMSELDGGLPPALLAEIAKFTERLRNVHTVVTALQGAGKVKQFFKQLDTAAHVKACKEDMDNTRAAFNIQAGAAAVGGALQMNKTAEKQHEALLAFIASHPELTNSELASLTSSRSNDSATSLSMLPPAPQIFYGRESELDEVLSMLKQDRARMVILGMGGMGKTTLATAALNHPDVIAKFPARYFVSCHSTASRDDLVSSIVAQLNLERGSNSVKKVLQHFTRGPATLLVLDNFETVWEPTAGRSKVEDFLSVLAEIPQLALLITMRGAERPQKVKWTRPFIPLLTPLSTAAALRTFLDIADDAHDPPSVQQLLEFTGNLPLAVNLMANVVAYEGCANTLARWASERTRLLSNGYDARSSLDISIMLSCSGARMTPPAQALLGLLAMLPDGLSEAELLQSALPIPNVLLCKARLTLLFPIREYARVAHPPPPAVVAVFRAHVHRTLALWDTYDAMMAWEVAPRLALVIGNVQAVLSDALAQGADAQTVASVLAFSHLLREESQPSPLLEVLAKDANLAQTPEYGAYLVEKFWAAATSGHAGVEAEIVRGTEYFENREGIEKGRWFNALGSYYYRANNLKESLRNVQRAVELATSLPHPTREAMVALQSASMLLDIRGDHAAALLHAKRARACAELLVDLPGQVMSMSYEIRLLHLHG